jgi:chromosome segregation ATPase
MKLFSSTRELEERIAALESELESAQNKAARADELDRELAELKSGFDAERAEWQSARQSIESDLQSAQSKVSELESANDELTKHAEITKEKVSLEASRQLAAAGHPPVEGVSGEDPPDPYAGKSKEELQIIAQSLNRNPKAQADFVKKYLVPLIGK